MRFLKLELPKFVRRWSSSLRLLVWFFVVISWAESAVDTQADPPKTIKGGPVKPHALWAYLKVTMVLDNGVETRLFGIPSERCPPDNGLLKVIIANTEKVKFDPFPKKDDQIVVCGNASGDTYSLQMKAFNGWQIWPGDVALHVFCANQITGTVVRSGLLRAGGELIVVAVPGKANVGAYVAPGMLPMFSQFPGKGDLVTVSGPRPEDQPNIINVVAPMQLTGDHVAISEQSTVSSDSVPDKSHNTSH